VTTFLSSRIDVAVKRNHYNTGFWPLGDTHSDPSREASLLREAEIMARVRGHNNVIFLQGIMIDKAAGKRVHPIMALCTNQGQ
jgi:hypothetical protein